MFRKGIVLVVILLLVGVAVAPSINANLQKERMIRIPVTEYKADGTKEISIVKMSWSDLMILKGKLQNTKDSEEILSLYKEYGLIPQDASLDKMREGMLRLAERLGISKEKLSLLSKSHKPYANATYGFGIDYYCEVFVAGFFDFNLPVGLSFFTGLINWCFAYISEIPFSIPSVDLLQFYFFPIIGFLDTWHETEHVLRMSGVLLFCVLIGFVGFSFQLPIFSPVGSAFGYSVATIALGHKW